MHDNHDQYLDSINVPIQRKIVTTKIETHFWTKTLQSRMTALWQQRTLITLVTCYAFSDSIYLHFGNALHPKNSFPAVLPFLDVLDINSEEHLGQVLTAGASNSSNSTKG